MINVQGKDFPDRDKWMDPTGQLSYTYSWDGDSAVLTRKYNKRTSRWMFDEPNEAVIGFHAMIRGTVGLRSDPPGYKLPKKKKSRGYNHRAIRELNDNKCQMPGCSWPPDNRVSCEIHHIIAVKDGGDEAEGNKVCLCPNHHAEADKGIIEMTELLEINGTIE
jgi:hypothetical protein